MICTETEPLTHKANGYIKLTTERGSIYGEILEDINTYKKKAEYINDCIKKALKASENKDTEENFVVLVMFYIKFDSIEIRVPENNFMADTKKYFGYKALIITKKVLLTIFPELEGKINNQLIA